MTHFKSGATAKLLVSRLYRVKSDDLSLNITKIWQLRRREKAKVELLN